MVGCRGKLYVFGVLVFGFRVAPTSWGWTGAFLARSTQSMVPDGVTRVELHVDDPIIFAAEPHAEMKVWWARPFCLSGQYKAWPSIRLDFATSGVRRAFMGHWDRKEIF
eukprot:2186823-Amphidinium_carterae.1